MMQMDTLKKTMKLNIWFLRFYSYRKKQRSIKKYTKLWEETKRQIEVINDDEPIEY